eukprot:scaffold282_cov75-Phaeocystis_antarctica.AAC.2
MVGWRNGPKPWLEGRVRFASAGEPGRGRVERHKRDFAIEALCWEVCACTNIWHSVRWYVALGGLQFPGRPRLFTTCP